VAHAIVPEWSQYDNTIKSYEQLLKQQQQQEDGKNEKEKKEL
jgi:hypothetical protein